MSGTPRKSVRERFAELRQPGVVQKFADNLQDRRNDFDVTDTVQVSSVSAVRDEVKALFSLNYPGESFDRLWLAFYDFDRLFSGRFPGYLGCDTTYHDKQHSLDMTLAMARLVIGYERTASEELQLGPERAEMGLITSLFHDSGYIRHIDRDRSFNNGAEFTRCHVTRSADFLRSYLPHIGLGEQVNVASQIVHFTGYEIDLDHIELDDPRDSFCGHLLGTADLIAQMADRCYLEKCRDRLFSEFVLGGVAIDEAKPGEYQILYESAEDLLRKTPQFVNNSAFLRLDNAFGKAYRYLEVLFAGKNPYLDSIKHNMQHLDRVIDADDFSLLRRSPPCFVSDVDSVAQIGQLVERQIRKAGLPMSDDGLASPAIAIA